MNPLDSTTVPLRSLARTARRWGTASVVGVVVLGASGSALADPAFDPPPPPRVVDKPAEPSGDQPRFFSMGALAGVGFPRPLSFELFTKLGGYVGLGAEYGLLPQVTIQGFGASSWAASLDTRVFPFRNAFFFGLRGGYQQIDATGSAYSFTASAELATWFLNPRIGLEHTFGSWFTLATEAGVQLPLSSSFSSTLPDGLALAVRDSTVVRTLSGVLPTVDLLRVGAMF